MRMRAGRSTAAGAGQECMNPRDGLQAPGPRPSRAVCSERRGDLVGAEPCPRPSRSLAKVAAHATGQADQAAANGDQDETEPERDCDSEDQAEAATETS
jgi:hypothetical protein